MEPQVGETHRREQTVMQATGVDDLLVFPEGGDVSNPKYGHVHKAVDAGKLDGLVRRDGPVGALVRVELALQPLDDVLDRLQALRAQRYVLDYRHVARLGGGSRHRLWCDGYRVCLEQKENIVCLKCVGNHHNYIFKALRIPDKRKIKNVEPSRIIYAVVPYRLFSKTLIIVYKNSKICFYSSDVFL